MMTMQDIESLERRWKLANDLQQVSALSRAWPRSGKWQRVPSERSKTRQRKGSVHEEQRRIALDRFGKSWKDSGMCKFLSGLYFKNGDVFDAAEHTQSHDVMIRAHGIVDAASGFSDPTCVRWEFAPPDDLRTVADMSTWSLRVDEKTIPEWWDADKVRAYCERRVRSMIIDRPRGTVLGGVWILTGEGASIKELVGGAIAIVANGASLDGASLAGASLARANLDGANLDGANLDRASLAGASLARASLAGANLARAALARANLARASLAGAYLDGANLDRASLAGASGVELPAGWKLLENGIVVKA
jgi:hypothetical protein